MEHTYCTDKRRHPRPIIYLAIQGHSQQSSPWTAVSAQRELVRNRTFLVAEGYVLTDYEIEIGQKEVSTLALLEEAAALQILRKEVAAVRGRVRSVFHSVT